MGAAVIIQDAHVVVEVEDGMSMDGGAICECRWLGLEEQPLEMREGEEHRLIAFVSAIKASAHADTNWRNVTLRLALWWSPLTSACSRSDGGASRGRSEGASILRLISLKPPSSSASNGRGSGGCFGRHVVSARDAGDMSLCDDLFVSLSPLPALRVGSKVAVDLTVKNYGSATRHILVTFDDKGDECGLGEAGGGRGEGGLSRSVGGGRGGILCLTRQLDMGLVLPMPTQGRTGEGI
jgi:hypothetical protein